MDSESQLTFQKELHKGYLCKIFEFFERCHEI